MNIKNTAIVLICATISLQSAFAMESLSETELNSVKHTETEVVSEYTKYFQDFKSNYENELKGGDFRKIDAKIKGYMGDINFLSENEDSEHFRNIEAYRTKLQALKDLRAMYVKSELKETLDTVKKEETRDAQLKRKLEVEKINENKKQIKSEIKDVKSEIKDARSKLKDKKTELRTKYKKQFHGVLSKKLESISNSHMKVVLSRVDKAMGDIEKTNIIEARKNILIAQLEAIKELLEDRLEETELTIDIEALFQE